LAELITASLRVVILIVLSASLAAVVYMTQRERAYECGVLRALGLTRVGILLPPLIEGVGVLVLASALAVVVMPGLTSLLGIETSMGLRDVLRPIVVVSVTGLVVIVCCILSLSLRPVAQLLRDPWSRG